MTSKSAQIAWLSDEVNFGEIEYGLSKTYGNKVNADEIPAHQHSLVVPNLEPSTTYHYRVKSTDYVGNVSVSEDQTFTTSELKYTTLSATVNGDGGNILPVGDTEVILGDKQLYQIKTNKGYNIAQVLVDGVDQGKIDSYEFNNVVAAHTITVIFERLPSTEQPLPNGPVLYYSFDNVDAADVVADLSGNDRNGFLKNGAQLADGLGGKALLLDGDNDYMEIADNAALNLTGSFTIGAWIKRDRLLTGDVIYDAGADAGWGLKMRGGATAVEYRAKYGGYSNTGGAGINDKLWHHVLFIKNEDITHFYIDGELARTFRAPSSVTPKGIKKIGAQQFYRKATDSAFKGVIDNFVLYDRVLTEAEVKLVYQNTGLTVNEDNSSDNGTSNDDSSSDDSSSDDSSSDDSSSDDSSNDDSSNDDSSNDDSPNDDSGSSDGFSLLSIDGTTAEVLFSNDFEQGVGSLNVRAGRVTSERTTENALNGNYSFKMSSSDFGSVHANHDYDWGAEVYAKAAQIYAKARVPEGHNPKGRINFCAVVYQVGSLRTESCQTIPGTASGDVTVDVTLDIEPTIKIRRVFYYIQFKGYAPYNLTVDDMQLVLYRTTDGESTGSNDSGSNSTEEVKDSDGDGVEDSSDAFPNDASETKDSDGDGVGDNADAFPNDATETKDSDGDGVGDNADAFPNDANETKDSDGDGVGDNADAFPNDATETKDSDGDGIGDNADTDFAFLSIEGTKPEVLFENNFEQGIGSLNIRASRVSSERTTNDALNGSYSLKLVSSDFGSVHANHDYKWGAEIYAKAAQIYAKARVPEGHNPKGRINFCAVVYQAGSLRTENCQTIPGTQSGDVIVDVTLDVDPTIKIRRVFYYIQFKGYAPYNLTVDDMHLVLYRTAEDEASESDGSDEDTTEEVKDADGDGVEDSVDAFPNDANESKDSDGDGVGDNADVFPTDATETKDSDGDGIGDNSDDDFVLLSIEGTIVEELLDANFESDIDSLVTPSSRVTTELVTDGALSGQQSLKLVSRDHGNVTASHDYAKEGEVYAKALQAYTKARVPEGMNPKGLIRFCARAYLEGNVRVENCHDVSSSQTGDVTANVTLELDPKVRVGRVFYWLQFKGYGPYALTVDDMHLVLYRTNARPTPAPAPSPTPTPGPVVEEPAIEVDLESIAELGSGSDVYAGKFFPAIETSGTASFKVMPIESVKEGETIRVTFGVPFPRGYLEDVNNFVIKDNNGNEVPVFAKTTLPWRNLAEGTTMNSIRSVMVQMDTSFVANEYGHLAPNSYTLEWGSTGSIRTFSPIAETPVKDDWVLVDDQNYPAEYAIYEPKAFAVFSPEWYGDNVIKTRTLPFGSHPDFSAYDKGFALFGDTVTNYVDPRVVDKELQPYLTSFANWLFDRAQSIYQLGFRSGEFRYLREAHRASQFYASKINGAGYFTLKPYNDLKYVYGENLLSNYMLQGDDSLPAKVASMIPVWGTFRSDYTTKLNFWTERHAAYKLLGYVSAYEMLGTPDLAEMAMTTFNELHYMQGNPPEGVPVTGGLMHTGAQGSEGGSDFYASPWMSGLLLDAVERFYLHTGDTRVPEFVMDMADFFKRDIALHDTPYKSRRHKSTFYLVGENSQRPNEDWEHSLDTGKIMALAYYFSLQEEGIVTDNAKEYLQTLSTLYGTQVDFVFHKWLRTQSAADHGKAAVRLSPPRKFSWWFRTTSNMDFLVGEDAKLQEFDGVTIPQLSLVQHDFEQTHYAPGDVMTFDFTLTNTGRVAAKNVLVVLNTVAQSGHALETLKTSSTGGTPTGNNSSTWKVGELQPGTAPIHFSLTVRAKDFGVLQTTMRPATKIISYGDVRYCGVNDGEDICTSFPQRYNVGTQPNNQQSNWHVVYPLLPVSTPELEIVSHSDGDRVSGSQNFVADVTDVDGIEKVEFYLDDELLTSLTDAPYEVSYQTDSLFDDVHTLKVVAVDTIGSVAEKVISITPSNPDVIAPTVVINSPQAATYDCKAINIDYVARDLYSTTSCELIVDDVAVELAQCQNYQLPAVTDRLKARLSLPFDGNDAVVTDNSIWATHGAIVNGATRVNNEGSAMSFDGVDDYLEFKGHQLDISNDVTMAFWMNPTTDEGMIMSQDWRYIGTETGWAILLGPNNDRNNNTRSISWSSADAKGNYNNRAVVQTEADVIELNQWQHVAITKHDKEVIIYINGVESARGEVAAANIDWAPLAAKVFNIGKQMKHNGMYNKFYQGQLDDVLIWNETLTADQIYQLASNNPSEGAHSLTINATDPAGNVGSATVEYSVQACN